MNHPTRQDWMDYLYGELPARTRTRLDAHLAACPECKAAVASWRATMRQLENWTLPKAGGRRVSFLPVLKWAAAAAFVLGLGMVIGRAFAPTAPNVAALRAALLPELRHQWQREFAADFQAAAAAKPGALTNEFRRQLRAGLREFAADTLAASTSHTQQLLAAFAQSCNETRAADHQALLALFQDQDQRRQADYASLHQDLATVAINAQLRLDGAQEAIGELAAYAQAPPRPEEPSHALNPFKKSKGN
jgi:anti-sigma factor RsiW